MECNHVYVRTHLQGALYCWITTRHGCLYKWAFLLGFMALFSLATLWWGLQIVFTLHRFKVRRVGAHTSDPPWPGARVADASTTALGLHLGLPRLITWLSEGHLECEAASAALRLLMHAASNTITTLDGSCVCLAVLRVCVCVSTTPCPAKVGWSFTQTTVVHHGLPCSLCVHPGMGSELHPV